MFALSQQPQGASNTGLEPQSTVKDPTKFKRLLTDSGRIPVPGQELHARAQANCLLARSVASPRKQTFPATKLSTGAGKTSHGNRAPYSGLGHRSSRAGHSAQLEACWASAHLPNCLRNEWRNWIFSVGLEAAVCPALQVLPWEAFPRTVQDKKSSSGTSVPSHGSPVSFCWGKIMWNTIQVMSYSVKP